MKIPYQDSRDPNLNILINSNMDIWQRVVANATVRTNASNASGYTADRMFSGVSSGAAKQITVVRSTNIPTTKFPLTYSLQVTNNTVVSSHVAGEWLTPIAQIVEGVNYASIYGGIITLGFWIFSSVGGTVAVAARRNAFSRSYVTTVSVTPGVWEYKTVYIPLDTSGPAYVFDNTASFDVTIGAVSGTSLHPTALNAWESGSKISHSSATNWAATSGAVMRFAQMSLRAGVQSLADMRDGYRPYGPSRIEEYHACLRYYEKSYGVEVAPGAVAFEGADVWVIGSGSIGERSTTFKVPKRSIPGIRTYSPATGAIDVSRDVGAGVDRAMQLLHSGTMAAAVALTGAAPSTSRYSYNWTADAEL